MRPDQDEEKASKSGYPAMLSRNYQNSLRTPPAPENRIRGPFLQQHTEVTPCWHGGDEGGQATAHNARLARRF